MSEPWFIDATGEGRMVRHESGILADRQAEGDYADLCGDEERTVLAFLAARPWREGLREHFADRPWLRDIITDPRRAAAILQVPLAPGSRVLDVGSGWGQLAVPLAQRGHEVVCLDQTPSRLLLLQAIARQEGVAPHLVHGDIETLPLAGGAFDLIVLNGVLEWTVRGRAAEAAPAAHQAAVLRRCAGLLRPGGCIFLAIENALGLKYLMGSRDDHCGLPWVTLAGDDDAERRWRQAGVGLQRARTHDLAGYRTIFADAGLGEELAWACFPDYKLPRHVVPLHTVDNFLLNVPSMPEHHGDNGEALPTEWPLLDAYRRLACNGAGGLFAPSYAFLLSPKKGSMVHCAHS